MLGRPYLHAAKRTTQPIIAMTIGYPYVDGFVGDAAAFSTPYPLTSVHGFIRDQHRVRRVDGFLDELVIEVALGRLDRD